MQEVDIFNKLKCFPVALMFCEDHRTRLMVAIYKVGLYFCVMNKMLIFLSLFFSINGYAQSGLLKEVKSFHPNGKEKTVYYKNQDLTEVKKEEYAYDGTLLSFYNIDPKTKKYHGKFMDVPNKGTYNQGKLTCESCYIVISDHDRRCDGVGRGDERHGNLVIKGDFLEGKPVDSLRVFYLKDVNQFINYYFESCDYLENLPLAKNLLSFPIPETVRYFNFLNIDYPTSCLSKYDGLERRHLQAGRATFPEYYMLTLTYNSKGELDGKIKINNLTNLFFKDGVLEGFVRKNAVNTQAVRDSVFRLNKIWKVNNEFKLNNGYLEFLSWNEFYMPWRLTYQYHDVINYKRTPNNLIFFGSSNSRPIKMSVYDRNGINYTVGIELKETKYNLDYQGIYYQNTKLANSYSEFKGFNNNSTSRYNTNANNSNANSNLESKKVISTIAYILKKMKISNIPDKKLNQTVSYYTGGGYVMDEMLPSIHSRHEGSNELYVDEVLELVVSKFLVHPESPISKIYIADDNSFFEIRENKQIQDILKKIEKSAQVIEEVREKTNELENVLGPIDEVRPLDKTAFIAAGNINDELVKVFNQGLKDLDKDELKNIKVAMTFSAARSQNEKFNKIEEDNKRLTQADSLIKKGDSLRKENLYYDANDAFESARLLIKQVNQSNTLSASPIAYNDLGLKVKSLFESLGERLKKEEEDYRKFILEIEQNNIPLEMKLMPSPKKINLNKYQAGYAQYRDGNLYAKDYRTGFGKSFGYGISRYFLDNKPNETDKQSKELRDSTLNNVIRLNAYLNDFSPYFNRKQNLLCPSGIIYELTYASKLKAPQFGLTKDKWKVLRKHWDNSTSTFFVYHSFNNNKTYFFPYGYTKPTILWANDVAFYTTIAQSWNNYSDLLKYFASKEGISNLRKFTIFNEFSF